MTGPFAMVGGAILAAVSAMLGYRLRSRRRAPSVEDEHLLNLMSALSVETAHQMRNPLSSLKGHAQLLSRNLSEENLRDRAERIVRESDRLEKAISDVQTFLDLKRWHARSIDPSRVASDWIESVSKLPIRLDVSSAPSRWTMDPDRFVLVLDLLLRAILARRSAEQPVDLVIGQDDGDLVVLFGGLEAISEPRRKWKAWQEGDILYRSGYSIAEYVARRHKGRFALWEARGRMPLFRLTLGRL